MYENFYGLQRMPFNTTPDTRFFFHSDQHQEALSSLLYAVNERKGFTLLTGEIVELPQLKQLKQRIVLRYHLAPLSEREVQAYIFHRLKVAGADGALKIGRGALKAIYEYSGGIPRVVNIVCDNALLLGFVQETRKISEEIVREVIRDLEGNRHKLEPQEA